MIGIVGHVDRLAMVQELAGQTGAECVSIDDGTLGCERNHLKVWQHLADHNTDEWSIVLEDDAIPCTNFRDQLEQALAAAPAPIVSLYLGTGHPVHWQPRIAQAIESAGNANWLTHHKLLHAVGVATRTDLLPLSLNTNGVPIDSAISNWAVQQGHQVAYTLPSLVDHTDITSVITKRHNNRARTNPRKAWRHGTRDQWTQEAVPL